MVGTRVGGITETVLDILVHGAKGTGILVKIDDHRDLARGLISLLAMMKIGENVEMSSENQSLLDLISHDELRELVARNPSLCSIIRNNCRERVSSHFGPINAARMATKTYEMASTLSKDDLPVS